MYFKKAQIIKKLFQLAQELGVHCQAFSPSRGLITNETSQYTEHEASINQIDINIINPLTDITDEEDIIKVMFIDPPEILDELSLNYLHGLKKISMYLKVLLSF